MRTRYFWAGIAAIAILSITSLEWMLFAEMAPVRDGNATGFWEALCGVDLEGDGDRPWQADAYYVDEDWCAYNVSHLHGSDIYRVPTVDVERLLPEVTAKIESNQPEELKAYVLVGHAAWRDSDLNNPPPGAVPGLVQSIHDHQRRLTLQRNLDLLAYKVEDEFVFWSRWSSASWYWATVCFDWAFLSGWVLFVAWPGIYGKPLWRWLLHFAVAPTLFLTPLYLGYSWFTFTSAGPTGGVLYPHLLWTLRGGRTSEWDIWLLEHIPPLLSSLSTPIGQPAALTGMGAPSITGITIKSFALCVVVWMLWHAARRILVTYSPNREASSSIAP